MADLPDIPDEAVTEVARALHTRDKESGMHDPILGWYEELPEVQADYRDEARALLADALPVLNTARDAETARVDELDRWLNAGDVAGYASVEDLLNAMRVRRNWLAQGVPAIGPREIRETIAAELERRADEFVNQAKVFGNPHPSTPGAGVISTLLDLSREFRTDAAALRAER